MLKQLIHRGVVVPAPPEPVGLAILVSGEQIRLTPKQEEMALAWARKKDTPYVQDPVFVDNFLRDFSAELGLEATLTLNDIDFAEAYAFVDAEREAKASMTRDERKALAAQRKALREALQAQHGYAIVNGQRVELAAYVVEPSGIFMGRGEHPLRGRWKKGTKAGDVTLNLSPDAPPVDGDWAEVVWQPESMWVARWQDKLSGRLKYVWLSDAAPVKQEREARKFDRALELDDKLELLRRHINEGLVDPDARRRMIATACYLIDTLCLRVGDEKDPDEADTIGATTLRPEHLSFREGGEVEFRFLGKDAVEWHKSLTPPQAVLGNLAELVRSARPSNSTGNGGRGHPTRDLPQIFPDVTSRAVNSYLCGISPGITAKVFRTHHATQAVRDSLASARVRRDGPEHMKWRAASLANLEAAVLCNHTKQYRGNWEGTRERYEERLARAKERLERYRSQVKELTGKVAGLRQEAGEKEAAAKTPERRRRTRERYHKRLERAMARVVAARGRRSRAEVALGKLKAQFMMASKKRTWNLGTSLKSYIDPRVYSRWGNEVDYDVLGRYYPAALRRKFAWVRVSSDEGRDGSAGGGAIAVRTCMSTDLDAVAELFRFVADGSPQGRLPVKVEEIGRTYLPSLDEEWREAIVATNVGGCIVGFVAIGPEWCHEGEPVLDVFGVLHPEWRGSSSAELLASEARRRLRGYQVRNPKKHFELCPRETTWFACAPEIREALHLGTGDTEARARD